MKRCFSFVGLWAIAAACVAQDAPSVICMQADYRPDWPVVQVLSLRTGYSVQGTGIPIATLASGDRLVLTAAHVATPGSPTVLMAHDLRTDATIVARDDGHDAAVLLAQVPRRHPLRNFLFRRPRDRGQAPSEPPADNEDNWGGFTPEQYQQMSALSRPYGAAWICAYGNVNKGMSGGPVYNHRKELIGMIIRRETDPPFALALRAEWLLAWLAHVLPADQLASIDAREPLFELREWPRLSQPVDLDPFGWKPVASSLDAWTTFGRPSGRKDSE